MPNQDESKKAQMLVWDGNATEEELSDMEHLTPIYCVKVFDNDPVEIMRCDADGGIVTTSQSSLSIHAGHKMRQPVLLKREELDLIVRGRIK